MTAVAAAPSASTAPPAATGANRFSLRTALALLLDVRLLLLVSLCLISYTLWWCVHQSTNRLLSYADVPTHLNLARRVHDDIHPGLGQLGSYWLPLAHVIELPLIWNDTLWRTGLAGAIPSIACYLISIWCLYNLVVLATGERLPAMIAGLAFAANPNVLYLHVLAMFEPAIIASMLVATYFLARWLGGGGHFTLVAAAGAVCVASTSRYEAWGFAMGSGLIVAAALWQAGHRGKRLRGYMLFYLMLAWYGMALWVLWNLTLNGDPFYFLHPGFNKGLGEDRLAILTKHHPYHAVAYVALSVADNAGPLLVGLGALGFWRVAVAFGVRARMLWIYLLAAPAAFDAFYLWYKGTPPILVPQLLPYASGNIRYGVVTLPFLCVLIGYLARKPIAPSVTTIGPRPRISLWPLVQLWPLIQQILLVGRAAWIRLVIPFWPLVQLALLAAVIAQPLILIKRNYVLSYNEPNTPRYLVDQQARTTLAHWLGAHYNGGRILMSTFKGADRIILDSGLPDSVFVHEGSQNDWRCANARPQRWVRWIVLFKGGDGAAKLLRSRSVYGGQYFTRILSAPSGGYYYVYRRNTRPWHPLHPRTCE